VPYGVQQSMTLDESVPHVGAYSDGTREYHVGRVIELAFARIAQLESQVATFRPHPFAGRGHG
jgi:hypothetical protein